MAKNHSHDSVKEEALKCLFLCAACNRRKTDLEVAAGVCGRFIDKCHRKFIHMSYCTFGCGLHSRNAQLIAHQCVGILYAMRVFYLHHCLKVLHPTKILEPSQISLSHLNSGVSSSFTAIQNIKRPGKLDIPEFDLQKITWSGSDFVSLHVHTGTLGLGRVPESHTALRNTYNRIVAKI